MRGLSLVVILTLSAIPAVVPASIFAYFFRSLQDPECLPDQYASYPEDCSKYLQCNDGIWDVRQCSGGTVWNPAIVDCDLPENVNCNAASSSSPTSTSATTTTTTTSITTTSTTTTPAPTTNPTTASTPTTRPTPSPSPPEPCIDGEYSPYIGNCGNFYQCEEGRWTAKNCPDNTIWDQIKTECDFPGNAICNNSTDIPIPSNMSIPCELIGELLSFPGNCSKFYQCSDNILVPFVCEPGLLWNDATKKCDYHQNVNCIDITTEVPTSPTTTSITTTTTTTAPTNATTTSPTTPATTTTPPTPAPNGTTPVPVQCDHDGLQFPYPGDCTKYYECAGGGLEYVLSCREGLLWNDDIKECDNPKNVICDGITGPAPATVTPTTNGTTPAPVQCIWDGQQFPYPGDCTKYYECAGGGLKFVLSCREGLLWNNDIKQCDNSENVSECQ